MAAGREAFLMTRWRFAVLMASGISASIHRKRHCRRVICGNRGRSVPCCPAVYLFETVVASVRRKTGTGADSGSWEGVVTTGVVGPWKQLD